MIKKSKKLLLSIITLLLILPIYAKETKDISDERAIILINYLNYSLSQIITNPDNRLIANHEFEKLDSINSSIIKDENIIKARTKLQKAVSEVKLNADEREYAEILAARARENAIFNIFSSAGSVFVPGQNPVLSIVYASMNAGLNYAGAIKRANDEEFNNKFKDWKQLKYIIDDVRIDLGELTALAFSYRDDTIQLIDQALMDDFTKVLLEEDLKTRENNLKALEPNMKMFPPFWFAYGYTNVINLRTI